MLFIITILFLLSKLLGSKCTKSTDELSNEEKIAIKVIE